MNMNEKFTKTYKLRQSGNSSISTIPLKVKQLINVENGDEIEFIIVSKQILLQKARSVIDKYNDTSIQNVANQYNSKSEK